MNLKLSKSKFRVVLTEVLPYERPLFYSNRFFARLIKHYDICISGNKLVANRNTDDEGIDEFLTMLSGETEARLSYSYFISKDGLKKGRCLTVMHPFHQVKTMELYDKYSKLIINFCERSKFSIRFPSKIASTVKWSTKFDKLLDDDAVEKKNTESAKSYFHYEEFNNISKFFDSYKFLNIEKRFEHLLKVDISKCFDSISPKLLSNLVYNNGINTADELSENDFIYDFIRLHEEMRVGQTLLEPEDQEKVCIGKGIIIGPELSRIFAEIFLQQIDIRVEGILKTEHQKENPKDYVFCRYVDDSFIAANSIEDLILIKNIYSKVLKEYELELKEDKITLYRERPFIDGLSLVKTRLKTLVETTFENKLSTFIGFQKVQEGKYNSPVHHTFKTFISELRVLVAETYLSSKDSLVSNNNNNIYSQKNDKSDSKRDDNSNTKKGESEGKSRYKDITSFALGIMERNLLELLQDYNNLYREYSEGYKKAYISDRGSKIKKKYESEFGTFCLQLIESLFFILNSDLRMSTSISVVRILDIIQRFVRGKYIFRGNIKSKKFQAYLISKIDEKITNETVKIFRHKSIGKDFGLMEILNLLELQHLMFPRNKVSEGAVMAFLKRTNAMEQFHFFTVFQLIHFAQGNDKYYKVIEEVNPWLRGQYKRFIETHGGDTESLLTVMELFCAPEEYVKAYDMNELMEEYPIFKQIRCFIGRFKSMFISWEQYSLAEEMSQRKGLNVY